VNDGALGTRVRLLPEVIDISFVLTCSGAGALPFTLLGASLRYDPDRLARLVVLGNLAGGIIGFVPFVLAGVGVL
jgi:hypothetical protein